MVETNFRYVRTLPGILKLSTVTIGLIVLITMIVGKEMDEKFEKFYFFAILISYIFTIIYYILHLVFRALTLSRVNVGIDIFFQLSAAILSVIAASFFIVSAQRIRKWDNTVPGEVEDDVDISKYGVKITSAAFAIINAILYILAALFTLSYNPDDDSDPYPEPYIAQQAQRPLSPQVSAPQPVMSPKQ